MRLRSVISPVLLATLLMWSMSALCAPLSELQHAQCMGMMYKTMTVEHRAMHSCCPPEEIMVVVCYRMHGGGCDAITACLSLPTDEALVTTVKYRGDGQARSSALAHATTLLTPPLHFAQTPWEAAAHSPTRSVLDSKADLRI